MRGLRMAVPVLFLVLAACGGGGATTATTPNPPGGGGGGGGGGGTTCSGTTTSVSVVDNAFNPSCTKVAVGSTVTWTWAGANPHNVTFPTGASSATQTTGTFERAFPTAGTFNYSCTVHAGMNGSVVVE